MAEGIIDKIMQAFKGMEKDEATLTAIEGGIKVDLFESAKTAGKDIYYQALFSGGGAMPLIEKTLGSAGAHEFKLLTRYLSGSGEDMPLSDDQSLIDSYLQTIHNMYGSNPEDSKWHFQPTTNTEKNPDTGVSYADENWEYMQVSPKNIMYKAGIEKPDMELAHTKQTDWLDIYNRLGETSSVRRRQLENGDYEYMIVEPWDLVQGEKEEGGIDYAEESAFGSYTRQVPNAISLLTKFAPDFVTSHKTLDKSIKSISIDLSDYGQDWIDNRAKPFNITGRSIISN